MNTNTRTFIVDQALERAWNELQSVPSYVEQQARAFASEPMEKTGKKPQRIQIEIEKIVHLSCPCGAQIDNPAGVGGYITQDEWASLPELIQCPSCGTVLIIPKRLNPYK